ncbi:MAG: 50S ribosomal protein L6 [Chloroflexi bacterium]|nr:50S ribosomal protein L6 [Chloroflexota bacterium]
MSRIGRLPITVPSGVTVQREGNRFSIKGPRGELTQEFPAVMDISYEDGQLTVRRPDDSKNNRALHGMTRALLANMVTGVTTGFTRRLEFNGVGYRVDADGDKAVLLVGFSHPVRITPPEGIKFSFEQNGHILIVEGNDKQLVGHVASTIRDVAPPEPYLGKGIAYAGEVIRRKAGKAGKGGGK